MTISKPAEYKMGYENILIFFQHLFVDEKELQSQCYKMSKRQQNSNVEISVLL